MSDDQVSQPRRPRTSRKATAARTPRRGGVGRIVQAVLLVFTVIVVVDTVAGDQGWLATRESTRKSAILKGEYDRVVAENAALEERIRRLNEDEALMEELARRELGFIRPGERLFIIKDLPSPAP